MEKVLVTGGAGFIGSNFIRHILEKYENLKIVNLDKLTYAGNPENLRDMEKNLNYSFVRGDICDEKTVEKAMQGCDSVLNFAAESHVDRSINDPASFIRTDMFGAHVLLEQARKQGVKKFVQISTDEVYGSIMKGSFNEDSPLNPSNPYSASKAGADRLAYSYFVTYGLPVVVTRSSNNFGPHQFPEKLIPLFVTNLIQGKKVPLYGDGQNVRDWLFVKDNCAAIELVLQKGKIGETYNVGGGNEKTNREITELILNEFGKDESMIEFVKDRLGHDRRYSLNFDKIKKLGFSVQTSFEKELKETIDWYKNNENWWRPLLERAKIQKKVSA